jgi:hypothetical protein
MIMARHSSGPWIEIELARFLAQLLWWLCLNSTFVFALSSHFLRLLSSLRRIRRLLCAKRRALLGCAPTPATILLPRGLRTAALVASDAVGYSRAFCHCVPPLIDSRFLEFETPQ